MRILFINTLYHPDVGGGAEITLSNIVNGLSRRGHEVRVLTTHGGRGRKDSLVDGITVHRLGIRNIYWHFSSATAPAWKRFLWHVFDSYNPLAKRDIQKIFDEYQPEIISSHNLPGLSIAAWIAGRSSNIPVVQVLHDYYTTCPKTTRFKENHNCVITCTSCALLRLPHTKVANKLNAVVGVSEAVLNRHLQTGLFADVPLKKVIYNARKLKINKPTPQNKEVLTFGFIGTLTLVKGIVPLLDSFLRITNKFPHSVKLVIAGKGKDDFVTKLKQAYISENIIFLGHVEPSTFFYQTDVTVVPSLWHDPFPGVVFESLGYGVPVIGSNLGGIPEMVQNDQNGLLFDPDENYALDSAMIKIIEQPQLLKKLKKNTTTSVSKFMDEERMINEHELLLQQILMAV